MDQKDEALIAANKRIMDLERTVALINAEVAKAAAAEQPAQQALRSIAMICGNAIGN